MDHEEKILEKIKKVLNRKNISIICDGFVVDDTGFDFIAENESKDKIFIVGHSFSDDLDEDIVIDRKIADKAVIEAIRKIGCDPGDRGIEFCWIRIKMIDENKAILSIEFGVTVRDISKPIKEETADSDQNLKEYEKHLINEFYELAERTSKLGKFIVNSYNKSEEEELDCPIYILVSQFNHMREYLSILLLRAEMNSLPINMEDFLDIVVISDSIDSIIDKMIASSV